MPVLTRLPCPDEEQRVEKTRHIPVARDLTPTLAGDISEARENGFTSLARGGDCSVVLGRGLALARPGRDAPVAIAFRLENDFFSDFNPERFIPAADLPRRIHRWVAGL